MDAEALSSLYDRELTTLLDQLIPARSIRRRQRLSDPYFDAEFRAAKRLTRRLERAAAAPPLQPRDQILLPPRKPGVISAGPIVNFVNGKVRSSGRTPLPVAINRSSPRQLWSTVDQLLGRGRAPVSNANDVDSFLQFFIDKVGAVRDATAGGRSPCFASCPSGATMTEFRCVTVEEVIAAIRKLPDKSCALDVLPTSQLKLVADLIAPFLCELFNRSLTTATVPEAFKFAYVTPRLKN